MSQVPSESSAEPSAPAATIDELPGFPIGVYCFNVVASFLTVQEVVGMQCLSTQHCAHIGNDNFGPLPAVLARDFGETVLKHPFFYGDGRTLEAARRLCIDFNLLIDFHKTRTGEQFNYTRQWDKLGLRIHEWDFRALLALKHANAVLYWMERIRALFEKHCKDWTMVFVENTKAMRFVQFGGSTPVGHSPPVEHKLLKRQLNHRLQLWKTAQRLGFEREQLLRLRDGLTVW